MSHETPRRTQQKDYYQRLEGQRSSSTEKKKVREQTRVQAPFFTNSTSVNIATAFARAHITSDTIKRRPKHLQGAPMSPSQIPRMTLDNPHFDTLPPTGPRLRAGLRPVRNITSKPAAGASNYNRFEDQENFLRHTGSSTLNGIVYGRDPVLTEDRQKPAWLTRAKDRAGHTPFGGIGYDLAVESPSLPPGNPDVASFNETRMTSEFGNSFLDGRNPYDSGLGGKFDSSFFDDGALSNNGPIRPARGGGQSTLRSISISDDDDSNDIGRGGSYNFGGGTFGRPSSNQYAYNPAGRTSAARGGIGDDEGIVGTGRTSYTNVNDPYTFSGSTYGGDRFRSSGIGNETTGYAADAASRFSARTRYTTPGRGAYDPDPDFGQARTGRRAASSYGDGTRNFGPTPFTARINGPGAFPPTAKRFSQQRNNKNNKAKTGEDPAVSPTNPQRRFNGAQNGKSASDLLAAHNYLSVGSKAQRGWDDYLQRDDQRTMRTFSDSFVSNSSNDLPGLGGGGGGSGNHDNPTLLKRLFRNIMASWGGSTGTTAERMLFPFLIIYFSIKELAVLIVSFAAKLLFRIIIGTLYSGTREAILLPLSLWRLIAPGEYHDSARTMTGILTGLAMVALSIIASQYTQPLLSSLPSIPSVLSPGRFFGGARSPTPNKRPVTMPPLPESGAGNVGGQSSAVVDRLAHVEQTLKHLYSLMDTLKSHREEEQQDVFDSLEKLERERQQLLSEQQDEKKRISDLEESYGSLKRDMQSQISKGGAGSISAKDMQSIKRQLEKLARDIGSAQAEAVRQSKSVDRQFKDYNTKLDRVSASTQSLVDQAKKTLEEKIANLQGGRRVVSGGRGGVSLGDVRELVDAAIREQEKELRELLKPEWLETDGDVAYDNVARMIEGALNRFANDRIGKTDFALFSAGSRIIPGLTSQTYEATPHGLFQKALRAIGMTSSQPPTAIIDPNTHVGECWPMRGPSGQVAVHLGQVVDLTEFGLEHVAKSVAIDWRSAPRNIEIWGYVLGQPSSAESPVDSANDDYSVEFADNSDDSADDGAAAVEADSGPDADAPHYMGAAEFNGMQVPPLADSSSDHGIGELRLLATYDYEPSDDRPMQIIPVDGPVRVRTLVLKVNSNWGHPDHTCIYRFRVHGHRAPPAQPAA